MQISITRQLDLIDMTLFLVTGLPGTGKSVLAKELSRSLQSKPIYLSTDDIRRNIFDIAEHQYAEFGKEYYTPQNRQIVYNALYTIVDILIKQNLPVIVDGTFHSEVNRKPLLEISNRYKCKFIVIKTICSEKVVKKRILDRKSSKDDISDADFNIYLEVKKRFEPISNEHLTVNTEEDLINNLKEVGNYIAKIQS